MNTITKWPVLIKARMDEFPVSNFAALQTHTPDIQRACLLYGMLQSVEMDEMNEIKAMW